MQSFEILEKKWAEFNELDPAGMVACSSGTAALHLAFEAACFDAHHREVVMSDYNMIACPRAVVMAGMSPVFEDCDDRLLLKPQGASRKATLVTHIYGRTHDMDTLDAPFVVEDLAEAHGVRPGEGTDAACWSFYRNKIVAGEEGGAVWFSSRERADKARQLRCLGFTKAHDFVHVPRGHNYRMSNVHAELVLKSMRDYIINVEGRRVVESWYDSLFPEQVKQPPRDAPWVYDIRIRGMNRQQQKKLVKSLNDTGIEARMGFWPMSLQPEFQGCNISPTPNSWRAGSEVIYLPLHPDQSHSGVQQIAEKVLKNIPRSP